MNSFGPIREILVEFYFPKQNPFFSFLWSTQVRLEVVSPSESSSHRNYEVVFHSRRWVANSLWPMRCAQGMHVNGTQRAICVAPDAIWYVRYRITINTIRLIKKQVVTNRENSVCFERTKSPDIR